LKIKISNCGLPFSDRQISLLQVTAEFLLSPLVSSRQDGSPRFEEAFFSFFGDTRVTVAMYVKYVFRPLRKKSFAHAFRKELTRVPETAIDVKRKREELKAKRNLIFERFLKDPLDTHLALEIKIIDDQVAKFAEQMQEERQNGTRVQRLSSPRPSYRRKV
jgi:hypothetical protein